MNHNNMYNNLDNDTGNAVCVDVSQPVLFIDTSYYIFYRYYAVFNWYKLSQKQAPNVRNIMQDETFVKKFDKLFEESLNKFCKAHKIPYGNVVFAKDCMRDHIWRFEFYKEYKKSRDERLETFNGDIFKHAYNKILPKLEEQLGIQSCEHCCSEADDIIAVFTRKVRREFPETQVIIVTNDNDYLQLIDDKTLLVNMKNKEINSRLIHEPKKQLLIKILLGDKSDNIPPAFPKCGEKRALSLAENKEELESKLASDEDFKAQFELNTLLMDTTCIPDHIKEELENMLVLKD
jgi:5'-3' exonuclease